MQDGTVRYGTVGSTNVDDNSESQLLDHPFSLQALSPTLCITTSTSRPLPSRACGPFKVIKFGEIAVKKNQRRRQSMYWTIISQLTARACSFVEQVRAVSQSEGVKGIEMS